MRTTRLRRQVGMADERRDGAGAGGERGWAWWEEKGKGVMAKRQSKGQVAGRRTGADHITARTRYTTANTRYSLLNHTIHLTTDALPSPTPAPPNAPIHRAAAVWPVATCIWGVSVSRYAGQLLMLALAQPRVIWPNHACFLGDGPRSRDRFSAGRQNPGSDAL